MAQDQTGRSDEASEALTDVPDRICTWCKVAMMKRLVGGGQFVHYTCPQCIFQHTSKRATDQP